MFFFSKISSFLLSPLLWITIILVLAYFSRSAELKKKMFKVGLGGLIIFSNGFLINEILIAMEPKPVLISELKKYETAIILTGVTIDYRDTKDRVHFGKGADRVLHAVQLFKIGKIGRIIISGGSSSVIGARISEAVKLREVFIISGVPDSLILLEHESRNTVESARYTKGLVDSLRLNNEFLLITSASHIPRSLGCFKKAGLNVEGYPVDFYAQDRSLKPTKLFLPSEDSFGKWSIVTHEIIGYIVYKFWGYC